MANEFSPLAAIQYIQQAGAQGKQQFQQNKLMQLAGGVIGGDPQAYAQAAAIDPAKATSYQQAGDNIALKARGAAKYLQTALQANNPQQIAAARQAIKPFMDTLKPGTSYPLDMDPQQEMAGVQSFLAQTENLDPMFKQGTPTDVRSFQMMTANLTPEERAKAQKINLGLEGRASNAGYGFEMVAGADGRQRIQRRNPRTGAVEQYDEGSGDFVPVGAAAGGTGPSPQPAGGTVFRTSEGELFDVSKIADPTFRAAVMANPSAYGMLPDGAEAQIPPRNVDPSMFVGRSKEQEAGAVTQAQEAAKLPYAGQEIGMRTDAALRQRAGEAQIDQQTASGKLATQRTRDANSTLDLLGQAEALIPQSTGSALGNAVDAGAAAFGQSTRGGQAIASLRTISGQLVSKMPRMEGPQSDRDVQMYTQMAGDLANPSVPAETRLAALRTIRALQQKYADQAPATPPAAAGPAPSASGWSIQRVD